jgi:hypothetical protein
MPLWVDRTKQLKSGSAATHAVVIGTSHYSYVRGGELYDPGLKKETFDLGQAPIAATSAFRFAHWLHNSYCNPDAPLASVDLLLAPTDRERREWAELGLIEPGFYGTTRETVEEHLFEWRDRCSGRPDNVAILYIAGHGVARSKVESYVLLQDFARTPNVLNGAVDVEGVQRGMAGATMPQSQFYFVDACRERMDEFAVYRNLGDPLELPETYGGADNRLAPILCSASPDTQAFGIVGNGTFFSTALLESLSGPLWTAYEAPDERKKLFREKHHWHVSATKLLNAVGDRVQEIAAMHQREQTVVQLGQLRAGIGGFHILREPPTVSVIVDVCPERAAELAQAELWRRDRSYLVGQRRKCSPKPLKLDGVPAGLYSLDLHMENPYKTTIGLVVPAFPPEFSATYPFEQS